MKSFKKISRSRFRIAVVIIGLATVLGSLGFLIWKNYLKPQQQAATQQTDKPVDTPVVIPPKIASDQTLGSGFELTYPDGWTFAHSGASDPTSTTSIQKDITTLTSPSGNVQVVMTVQTNFPVGTNCTSDYIKLKHLETDTTPQFAEGRFAAYVVYFPTINFYQYHAGLQNNTEAIQGVSLTSNTACNFMFGEFIERPSSIPGVPVTHTLVAIRFVDLYNGDNLKSGVTEIQVAKKLTGEEYEQAKAIVQSVRVGTGN